MDAFAGSRSGLAAPLEAAVALQLPSMGPDSPETAPCCCGCRGACCKDPCCGCSWPVRGVWLVVEAGPLPAPEARRPSGVASLCIGGRFGRTPALSAGALVAGVALGVGTWTPRGVVWPPGRGGTTAAEWRRSVKEAERPGSAWCGVVGLKPVCGREGAGRPGTR